MEKKMLQKIADCLTNNTMDLIFPDIDTDCQYYRNGTVVVSGKEEVCNFFMIRKKAIARDSVACFAYPAVVNESEEKTIPVGTCCVALAQFDQYNCVGFMSIRLNNLSKITEFSFFTTPNVEFKVEGQGKWSIHRVPKDAHDAIYFRAMAYGIIGDLDFVPSRHIQRYDVFQEYLRSTYSYIYKNLVEGFTQGIKNAAGYLYVIAMTTAMQRKNGIRLVAFSENEATSGIIPKVEEKYQEWIDNGYEMGKKLFLGFTEYAEMRRPKDEVFVDQLLQSFMDMMLFGSVQANKDMDRMPRFFNLDVEF